MSDVYITVIGIGIQTFLYLLGGYAMVIRNDSVTKGLSDDVKGIQTNLKDLAIVITQLAVQASRLDNLSQRMNSVDDRVNDLAHGRGFIREYRGQIEGEYKGG